MTSEYMMGELRRIVGAYMDQRTGAVAVAAKEGEKKSSVAEKAAAYALGKAHGLALVLDELSVTFDIDPWACSSGRSEGAATREGRAK